MTEMELGRDVFVPPQSDACKESVAKVAQLLNVERLFGYETRCKEVGMAPSPITLVGPNGEHAELPAELIEAFRAVISPMMDGWSAGIERIDRRLTAQLAANLLALSLSEFVELLEADEMSYAVSSDGKRHYVKLIDVLVFEARRKAEDRARLEEMLEIEREGGFERTEEPVEIVRLGEF